MPFLRAALELVAGGYAEPEDVDNTWRIGTGAPRPFQVYDIIGLQTPYNIMATATPTPSGWRPGSRRTTSTRARWAIGHRQGFYKYL